MSNVLRRLIACTIAAIPPAFAGEPVRVPWDRVAFIVNDAQVTVETTSKRGKVDGRVVKVLADSIELQTRMGTTSVARQEVRRIRVHGSTRVPAGILLGAAAGAGLFALAAHPEKPFPLLGGIYQHNADGSVTELDSDPHPNYGLAAAVGAGVGGVTGWLVARPLGRRGITIEITPAAGPPAPSAVTPVNQGEHQ